jgi:long-chain acyl-CoA synthetase
VRNPPLQVIFPHEANLKQLASSLGVSGDLHELCQNEQIQEAVLKALNAVGKKSHLKPLETLQTVVLTDVEWTPQNEMLTAAQKLNRKVILKKHKKEIDVRPPLHLRTFTESDLAAVFPSQAVYP